METKSYLNPMDIPDKLLKKYNRSGPRYTSYPTAPQFKSDLNRRAITDLWRATNSRNNGLSLYTHFPFCRSRCLYCGCFTEVNHSPETRENYLLALKKEVDSIFKIIDPERKIQQLALGGGSPSFMLPAQLSDYIFHLRKAAGFAPYAELSVEIDPRGVDEDYLDQLIDSGFNRFSFGVQDLDSQVQKNINRILDENKLRGLISHLKNRNIQAINLDLIYGLPGQTSRSFHSTIGKVISLRPSRIALFGYAHVPWISPHQRTLEKYHIPDPAERMKLFGTAFSLLKSAGYEHIGMDHFALPDDELVVSLKRRTLTRNFMGYTTKRGLDLIGIGVSSISSVGMTYVQNGKDIEKYITNRNPLYWKKGIILTEEDSLRREIILDLFCNFHLDTTVLERTHDIVFSNHFSDELDELKIMESDGLIRLYDDRLEVTEMGRFFIRNICMTFDQYLRKERPEGRYSMTI